MTLAKANLTFYPPDKFTPLSPIIVLSLLFIMFKSYTNPAEYITFLYKFSSYSLPKIIFSLTDPLIIHGFYYTKEIDGLTEY